MKYKIRINPLAIADVQAIKAFIAEDNPKAAAGLGKVMHSKIASLADFSNRGFSLGDKINLKTDYCFLACGFYLIFYKIEGAFASVFRVLNAGDYLAILFPDDPAKD